MILGGSVNKATILQVSLRYAAVNSNSASCKSSGYSVTGGGGVGAGGLRDAVGLSCPRMSLHKKTCKHEEDHHTQIAEVFHD